MAFARCFTVARNPKSSDSKISGTPIDVPDLGLSLNATPMKQPVLLTKRLTLRRFDVGDAKSVQLLAGNDNVARSTLNIPHPYEYAAAKGWINTHQDAWNTGTGVVYAMALTETGELIGAISLHDIAAMRGELGYWVGEPYWGQGYCTEAARVLVRFSFENLGLLEVYAEHLSSNPASGRILQKVGMTHIGSGQKLDRYGRYSSMEFYGMTKDMAEHEAAQ